MNDLKAVLEEVGRTYLPTVEAIERMERTVSLLLDRTREVLSGLGEKVEAEPEIVGSAAKNTYLGEGDIDLFLLFPVGTDAEVTSRICFELGRRILDEHLVKYASHPYISGSLCGIGVDVVWAYRVPSGDAMVSAVDRTPFHTRYVNENLPKDRRDDVRLLKRFLIGCELYPSSLRAAGISGYLAELLVIRYGDFESVLANIALWKKTCWLEIDRVAKGEKANSGEPRDHAPGWDRFPDARLVFIDPVDPHRNVAAALSEQNYFRLMAAARAFLRTPSMSSFRGREKSDVSVDAVLDALELRGTTILSVTLPRPDVVEDILYPQLYKALSGIKKAMGTAGFSVLGGSAMAFDSPDAEPGRTYRAGKNSVVENTGGPDAGGIQAEGKGNIRTAGEVMLLFEVDREILPTAMVHDGPPVYVHSSRKFIAKWRDSRKAISLPFVEGERWKVITRREHTHLGDVVRAKIPNIALGKDLDRCAKMSCVVRTGIQVIDDRTRLPVWRLFRRGEPWM